MSTHVFPPSTPGSSTLGHSAGDGQYKTPTVAQVIVERINATYSREKAAQDGIYFWPDPLPTPGASFVPDPLVLFRSTSSSTTQGTSQSLRDEQQERIAVLPITIREAARLRDRDCVLNAILSNGQNKSPDGLMQLPLGLVDIPAEQKRDVFCVDLHGSTGALTGGPLFIAGAQNSGKATALQTMLLWLMARYTPSQLRCAVVDPNRDLEFLQNLPYTRATDGSLLWTDGETDEQLTQMAESCMRMLTQRRESYPNQRWEENTLVQLRSRGAELPFLLLIISNYHSFVERFKAVDALKKLALAFVEARALGAYIIVTSAEVSSRFFPADLMGKMGTKIALFLNEQQRYDLVGRSPASEPIAGRGLMLTRDRRMHEVQLALPIAGEDESIRYEALKQEILWLHKQL